MNVRISFKHLEHTPALDERIHEKTEKLSKYFEGNFDVHWVCWCDERGQQWAEVKLHGPHIECYATADADSLYKALDKVVMKAEKQLSKFKGKWRNRVHNQNYETPKHRMAKHAAAMADKASLYEDAS